MTAVFIERGWEKSMKALRSHKWIGRQRGGDPADAASYEWVRYCEECGMEDTCEDPLPECPDDDE